MRASLGFAAAALGAGSALAAPPRLESRAASAVNQTTCGGKTYSYNEMAGEESRFSEWTGMRGTDERQVTASSRGERSRSSQGG